MVDQGKLVSTFTKNGVEFFTGVPDSYLNGFCTHISKFMPPRQHVIAANEGNAIAIAAGYHLATNTIPLVYMQNSGMGNALNPLLSLADKDVYSVPMVLLIGWRGQDGTGDHEQHIAQGRLTTVLLDDLGIPFRVLSSNEDETLDAAAWSVQTARETGLPVALVAPKGVCAGEKMPYLTDNYPMSREDAIRIVLDNSPADAIFVATTGRATRELFFLRRERGEDLSRDFLNVGAMGHALSVAQGLALADSSRQVICLDGDAALIMHMGSLSMCGKLNLPNLTHVVLNNGSHESVGGQPSVGHLINFTKIAEGCGYITTGAAVETQSQLTDALNMLSNRTCSAFIDIRIRCGIRKSLPPIDTSPGELKKIFSF